MPVTTPVFGAQKDKKKPFFPQKNHPSRLLFRTFGRVFFTAAEPSVPRNVGVVLLVVCGGGRSSSSEYKSCLLYITYLSVINSLSAQPVSV